MKYNKNDISSISKHLTLFFACFCIAIPSFTQVGLIKNLQKDGWIDCKNKTFILIDSTNKINSQNIDNQVFKQLNDIKINPKFSSEYLHTYWLKLAINNPTDDTLKILFSAGIHFQTVLFQKSANNYIELNKSLQSNLIKNRPFRADDQYLPIQFLPKQSLNLLVKITDTPKQDFKIESKILSKNYVNQRLLKAFYDEYYYILFNGIVISILIFVSLFVIGLSFVNRQRYFIFYALYTLSIALFFLWEYENSPYFRAIFTYLPFLKFTGNSNIYILLTHIFYFLFITEFLRIKQFMPLADKVLRYTSWALILIVLIDLSIIFIAKRLDWSFELYYAFQQIFPVLNLTLLVIVFLQKGIIATFAKFGSTFLMIGGLAGFLTSLSGIEAYNFTLFRIPPSLIFTGGVLLEVICFSIAISYRTYQIQREQQDLNRNIFESELRTLRSQINPHFVFNSLNSIKSYILTHRSMEASEYLTDFSTLMRSILQHSKEPLISLTDELETARLYVKLEQLRFEDGFEFAYHCDSGIETDEVMIPPMLLQPYLENAVKHGLLNKSGERSLSLKVILSNEKTIIIEVEDNGIGREAASLLRKNTPKYQSMGMNINSERVNLLNLMNESDLNIEIIDKKEPKGTLIKIKIVQ